MITRSSSASSKKKIPKESRHDCPVCHKCFGTQRKLLEHISRYPTTPECHALLKKCYTCGKAFASQASLNKHYGQMVSCRLERSKPDIANIVDINVNKEKLPFVFTNHLAKVASRNNDIPTCISIPTSVVPKKREVIPFIQYKSKEDKLCHLLQEAETFLTTHFNIVGSWIKLHPALNAQEESSTPPELIAGLFDDLILKVIKKSNVAKSLCTSQGIAISPPLDDQVRAIVDDIVDDVMLEPSSLERNCSKSSSSQTHHNIHTYSRGSVDVDDVWHFLLEYIQISHDKENLTFSLNSIPPKQPTNTATHIGRTDSTSIFLPSVHINGSFYNPFLDVETNFSALQDFTSIPDDNQDTDTNNRDDPDALLDVKRQAVIRWKSQEKEHLTKADFAYIELYDILKESGVPIGLFDKVRKWGSKNSHILGNCHHLGRESFLKSLRKKVYGVEYGPLSLQPVTKKILLESGEQVSVTTFSFISSLVSMLTNKELMAPENLLLDKDDPFSLPPQDCDLDDVNSGRWYRDSWNKLCTNKERDVLLNIIAFIDETVIDKYSKMSLHPFSITLGIFNRNTRNLADAWKHLGYIPKLESSKSKVHNLHCIFLFLMKELIHLQENGGFHWDLEIGDRVHKVVFKPAVQFIIGDCEGHDDICARKKGHTLEMKGLCRDCNCKPNDADDPDHICHFFEKRIMEEIDPSLLKERGFHDIENAFSKVEMGSNPGGIYNATPTEHLHQMSGLAEYMIEYFLSCLAGASRTKIDIVAMQITSNYSRQSDRGFYPMSSFRTGVTKCSGLTSREKVGRIHALYICLLNPRCFKNIATQERLKRCSESNKNVHIGPLGYRTATKWLKLFEAMLVYDFWIRSPKHNPSDIRGSNQSWNNLKQWNFHDSPAMKATRKLMRFYKEMVQRTEGVGLKIVKFHHMLHHCRTISEHGSLLNVDSSRPESTHKNLTKDHAKKTQKRKAVLIEQTAKRLSEDVTVQDVKSAFMCKTQRANKSLPSNNSGTDDVSHCGGSKYQLLLTPIQDDDGTTYEATLKWKGKIPSASLSDDVCQAITKRLFFHTGVGGSLKPHSVLRGFTEYKPSKGVLFRAHPSYLVNEAWNDWAMINWNSNDEDEELVPAKLILFLDLEDAEVRSPEEHNISSQRYEAQHRGRRPCINDGSEYQYLDNGKWALVHSALEAEDRTQFCVDKPNTKMCRRFCLEKHMRLVPIETISCPAYCILDDPSNNSDENLLGYRILSSDSWGGSFKNHLEE